MITIHGAVRPAARPPFNKVMVPIGHFGLLRSASVRPKQVPLALRTAVGDFKWPNAAAYAEF